MPFVEKFLGQVRPSVAANVADQQNGTVTNATTLVTCGAGERIIVRTVFFANPTGSRVYYSLWHAADGSTTDHTTVLLPRFGKDKYTTLALDMYSVLDTAGSKLLVAVSTANSMTFSCYGAVFT